MSPRFGLSFAAITFAVGLLGSALGAEESQRLSTRRGPAQTVNLPPVPPALLKSIDPPDGDDSEFPLRANVPVEISPFNVGDWDPTAPGERVWRVRIASADADAMGIHFGAFAPAPGGKLFVSDDSGNIHLGPFTAEHAQLDRTLTLEPVAASALLLEYREPAIDVRGVIAATEVIHARRNHRRLGQDDPEDPPEGQTKCLFCDLEAQGITGPSTVTHGSTYTITIDVKKTGVIWGYNAYIYLSTNTTITSSDLLVAKIENLTSADISQVTVKIPNFSASNSATATGKKYWGLVVDAGSLDSNSSNNVVAGNSTKLMSPGLDQVAAAISGPSSALSGSNATINYTIENWGVLAATPMTARIYLSLNTTFDGNDILLASTDHVYAGTYSKSVALPISSAKWYWILHVLPGPEADTKNNTLVGNSIDLSNPPPVDYKAVSIAGPTTANVGQTVSVSYQTANIGGPPPASYVVQVLLSTDNVITTSDTEIASFTHTSVGSFQSSVTIPASTTPGQRYFGLRIVPPVGDTIANNVVAGNTVTIAALVPDLKAVSVKGPSIVFPEHDAEFTVDVDSIGTLIPATYTVMIFARDDKYLTADVYIGEALLTSYQPTKLVGTIPGSMMAGEYNWIAQVIPAVGEVSAADNAVSGNACTAVNPDVFPKYLSGPKKVIGGKNASVQFELATNTAAPASSQYIVRIYISKNKSISSEDILVGTQVFSTLGTKSMNVKLPKKTGKWYWGIVVSPMNGELATVNNTLTGKKFEFE